MYLNNLPRVSAIVEWKFPFEGYAKNRFLEWLSNHCISFTEYMEEASTGGTYVHKSLEEYMDGIPYKGRKYKNFVKGGIQFLKDTGIRKLFTEKYIRTKDYQGTIDLIAEYNGEEWILDWKTYGLAKSRWGLQSEYKKPYDKLKKARLQLSLYAYATGIKNIGVVELTEEGYHFHPLKLMDKKEIDEIVKEHKFYYVDNL